MKVLYKNKVGKLIPLKGIYCKNCIYYFKNTSVSRCKRVGLMNLCIGLLNYYEFALSSSDVLNYEN